MSEDLSPDLSAIDPSLLQEFISESQEILDGLDPLFVALETNPDDMTIVDGIFRPVHSVKGNSGFFGLTNIKNFAHIMENLLGEIRSHKRSASPPLIDLLLRGVDHLRSMINRLAQGDHSGSLTPDEEDHLERLNRASADQGKGTVSPDSAKAAAARVLETLAAVKSGATNGDLSPLEEAISRLIRAAVPEYFTSLEGAAGRASVGYVLDGEEVTGYVAAAESFIANIESNEKDEALCESFILAIQAIEDIGDARKRGKIVDSVEQLKDDFLTIHESGIGFDDLMSSLIRERFDAVLRHIDRVEVDHEGEFFLSGRNVTSTVRQMRQFVTGVAALEKEPEQTARFIANIESLAAGAEEKPDLAEALAQLLDEFTTIHGSDIGFDDLMQSLLSERLVTILSLLDRGGDTQYGYRLENIDVTGIAGIMESVAATPGRLADKSVREELFHALQKMGEMAESTSMETMGMEAVGLVTDIEAIFALEGGLDARMEFLVMERLEGLIGMLNKVALEPVRPLAPVDGPPMPEPAEGGHQPPAREPATAASSENSGKTLRVAEEKVDHFMSFVGELIIAGEVFAYIQKKLENHPEVRQVAQEFKNANLAFGELSSNLQKSLMEVRRVPLKSVLQKLHRIVRDTSASLGKKVEFDIVGEEVQIDKSLLEGLESPLVHMVRNSVDHGLEFPAERLAAGKPEAGRLWIRASANDEQFTLTLRDDGRGLDVAGIKEKAVSRGILTAEAARALPDKEAFRLIFNAGLSTATVVTDVSGRGVGMDVVLSNISKMNGNINVDSSGGEGTLFTITLPMTVTLTVIDGLVARIGGQFYIIPLSDVRESVRPTREQIHSIKGATELLDVRGELHPVVRLGQVLGIPESGGNGSATGSTAVLVHEKRGKSAAFLVDELIGQQSVVVKDLGKEFEHIRCLRGGSILGDGRVGLVLSVKGILEDLGLVPVSD